MKKLFTVMLVMALAMTFVGCKKEETIGTKVDKAAAKVEKEAAEMGKKLDKLLDQ